MVNPSAQEYSQILQHPDQEAIFGFARGPVPPQKTARTCAAYTRVELAVVGAAHGHHREGAAQSRALRDVVKLQTPRAAAGDARRDHARQLRDE